MNILIGYSYYPSRYTNVKIDIENWVSRLRTAGFDIDSFCLTPNPPDNAIYWPLLDHKWKFGDKSLLKLYDNLAKKLLNYDVFFNLNGINLHPEFVRQLNGVKVYACFDDPDSSEKLSKPVASYYDLCLVGNAAEVNTYKNWGVKNAFFWPFGFQEQDYNPNLTEDMILNRDRDIDLLLICEKKNCNERIKKLERYSDAFPEGKYYGEGWKNSVLPENQKIALLQRTKIGPNFHNSTGPVNFRTFILPANGVMQICDNKNNLNSVFELGKEIIGFNTVDEAIELTKYYLAHDEERIKIAVAGWERAIKDYNEINTFQKAVDYIKLVIKSNNLNNNKFNYKRICLKLKKHKRIIFFNKIVYIIKNYFQKIFLT